MAKARARHQLSRGPLLSPADREVFGWMCLTAISAGLDMAAIDEAVGNGDHYWAVLFAALLAATVAAYFWLAAWLIRFYP